MLNNETVTIKKVAILGAGVMGAQIAAHFINAGIQATLFDLPKEGDNPNALVEKAIKALTSLKPAPLSLKDNLRYIKAANYKTDLEELRNCDLVIEAISERLDWKEDLFQKISPYLGEKTILATNTSGLSINTLAEYINASHRKRFCGVHFFNPPRYMHLVELIPHQNTDSHVLENLETFLVTHLGKGVVYAKDTPNFVGNRIGIFSILATLKHAQTFDIGLEVVDALTGPLIARPKSATLRTSDIVGLDTLAHTVETMKNGLPNDPWAHLYITPDWMQDLISRGALGQKTKKGVYIKEGSKLSVYDIKSDSYRPSQGKPNAQVVEILKEPNAQKRFAKLRDSQLPEAQFLWACFRDIFHYAAYALPSIAESVRDVDLAMRWGFAWGEGPFETWQQADWASIAQAIKADIQSNKTLADVALPDWVMQCGEKGVYKDNTAYSPVHKQFIKRSDLPVYKRQYYPDPVVGEHFDEGKTLFENEAVRIWHRDSNCAILSFNTKLGVIGAEVLEGIGKAVEIAEQSFKGLIIWQRHGKHFSAGANLKEFLPLIENQAFDQLDNALTLFQQTCLKVRYANVPVIAAVKGYVFGGGCELMLHCARTVAALESYIGFVEPGVGLLPSGGGCKEMALRAAQQPFLNDHFDALEVFFKNIALAKVSNSAAEAKAFGYLLDTDVVVMNADELLFVAEEQVNALYESSYTPPLKPHVNVLGKEGIARIQTLLVNMKEGHFISAHDNIIATKIAEVLCGGKIEKGSEVNEDYLLTLERNAFIALAKTPLTQERIAHMLKTGKPLRN